MTESPSNEVPDDWTQMWTDESDEDIEAIRRQFDSHRRRASAIRWLSGIAILLGFVFTIGLLVMLPMMASIIVLVAMCWTVWGIAGWSVWQLRRAKNAAMSSPPSEFVALLEEHARLRQTWVDRGRYLIGAIGVFLSVWTVWFISDGWAYYSDHPWRAVFGVAGMVVGLAAAVYLNRRERSRVEDEARWLDELDGPSGD